MAEKTRMDHQQGDGAGAEEAVEPTDVCLNVDGSTFACVPQLGKPKAPTDKLVRHKPARPGSLTTDLNVYIEGSSCISVAPVVLSCRLALRHLRQRGGGIMLEH
jgi:hypothetical protein